MSKGITTEKRLRILKTGTGLSDATEHVSRGWFPANSAILAQVRDRLAKGAYRDPGSIVRDMKSDFALLTHCLRHAAKVAKDPGIASAGTPIGVLKHLSVEQFHQMLTMPEAAMSVHPFSGMKRAQAHRIKQTLVTTVTAEALAEKASVDPELVYSSASLRQLGVNLIAWNYPNIYSRALSGVRAGSDDLDTLLTRILGFSPSALGHRVVREWNLGLESCMGVNANRSLGPTEPIRGADMDNVLRLCEIGEAYAKASDPKHFPSAAGQLKTISRDINHLLGPKGLAMIRERVEAGCALYAGAADGIFDPEEGEERAEEHSQSAFSDGLLQKNSYARTCSFEMQEKLRVVYDNMVKGEVSTDSIEILVREVLPFAGFVRGCVFFLEQDGSVLSPMLPIGDGGAKRYRPISCATPDGVRNPIVKALYSQMPLKEEGVLINGERVSHITGVLGTAEKAGVLYLEATKRLIDSGVHEPVLLFKAIRQAFNDCFGLP